MLLQPPRACGIAVTLDHVAQLFPAAGPGHQGVVLVIANSRVLHTAGLETDQLKSSIHIRILADARRLITLIKPVDLLHV